MTSVRAMHAANDNKLAPTDRLPLAPGTPPPLPSFLNSAASRPPALDSAAPRPLALDSAAPRPPADGSALGPLAELQEAVEGLLGALDQQMDVLNTLCGSWSELEEALGRCDEGLDVLRASLRTTTGKPFSPGPTLRVVASAPPIAPGAGLPEA
ncbi:hypothetical protein [Pararhodospirillum oryzae]|uniref:Uncharacterized protein n=1 Tax=Pararhodospirillum oryzae TaxID=478448 RepID=A0A512H828_9PROT|nr:hypothetical protein [Pararhodospirillum oryzae]GEO81550.1 hypothetical protein ROR02_16810 [Pararhodospirillum oryzae]